MHLCGTACCVDDHGLSSILKLGLVYNKGLHSLDLQGAGLGFPSLLALPVDKQDHLESVLHIRKWTQPWRADDCAPPLHCR